jgi:flagellin FlaB
VIKMNINSGLWKDKRAFTGLEAAIVLTAFVVVAAVFSYVVLGAGFFTSDTAKQTIHTGVDQATSSVELIGDVVAYGCNASGGTTDKDRIKYIVITVALTAGQNSLDISNGTDATLISYTDENVYYNDLYNNSIYSGRSNTALSTKAKLEWTGDNDGDTMLEYGEKAKITIPIWGLAGNTTVSVIDLDENDEFALELKPSKGAVLPITRTIPSEIRAVTNLH